MEFTSPKAKLCPFKSFSERIELFGLVGNVRVDRSTAASERRVEAAGLRTATIAGEQQQPFVRAIFELALPRIEPLLELPIIGSRDHDRGSVELLDGGRIIIAFLLARGAEAGLKG